MSGKILDRIAELGLVLPTPATALANYVPYTYACGLLYMSGQLPKDHTGKLCTGQLGKDADVAAGQAAARLCATQLIAQLHAALGGNLDRVKKIVKLTCYVNSTSDVTSQPAVANGCSDTLVEVFGETVGRHARTAIGVAQLPLGALIEVDAIVEIEGAL